MFESPPKMFCRGRKCLKVHPKCLEEVEKCLKVRRKCFAEVENVWKSLPKNVWKTPKKFLGGPCEELIYLGGEGSTFHQIDEIRKFKIILETLRSVEDDKKTKGGVPYWKNWRFGRFGWFFMVSAWFSASQTKESSNQKIPLAVIGAKKAENGPNFAKNLQNTEIVIPWGKKAGRWARAWTPPAGRPGKLRERPSCRAKLR